jgi:inhibitor of cysteine peptidase
MKNIFLKVLLIALCTGITLPVLAEKNFSHKFKVMRIPLGKIITITLQANPTTGFSWQLVEISDKKILEFVKKEYIVISEKSPGSGGIENWSFKTLKSGKTVVILEYRRPWEKDIPAAKIEEFNIFVK